MRGRGDADSLLASPRASRVLRASDLAGEPCGGMGEDGISRSPAERRDPMMGSWLPTVITGRRASLNIPELSMAGKSIRTIIAVRLIRLTALASA